VERRPVSQQRLGPWTRACVRKRLDDSQSAVLVCLVAVIRAASQMAVIVH
jgi:hypothetical protein